MKLRDQLRSVRHTFAANRARAFLTLLGIMIGAGSIVLLASLLRAGEEVLLARSQRANEADLIQVRRDDPPAKQINRTRRNLGREDAALLRDSPLLDHTPVLTESGRDVFAEKPVRKRVRIVGTDPQALSLYHLVLAQGRFLSDEDLELRRHVCVVGHEVWRALLEEHPDARGDTINLEGQIWTVVGVLEDKPLLVGGAGAGTWMWNLRVLVPQTTFDSHYAPTHDVQRLFVRLAGAGSLKDRIRAVEGVVRAALARRHYGVENFKIEGEDSGVNTERLVLTIIKVLLLGTGLLSLFVGGINIMNIMLVTVTERTREIGVRRAIGASPRDILLQFLLEASFIAFTGGVIGVLGGIFLAWLTSVILTHTMGSWALHIEMWSVALGLALSIATGIVFGIFPAWRAGKLDPVEALRYE